MELVVVNKNNNERYSVYDISYDKHGYPHFLIYDGKEWKRVSAKYYRPLDIRDFMLEQE